MPQIRTGPTAWALPGAEAKPPAKLQPWTATGPAAWVFLLSNVLNNEPSYKAALQIYSYGYIF